MSSTALFSLIAIWVPTLLAPGPDTLQILRQSLGSRRAGLACVAGVVTGTLIWLIASLAGLSALVRAVPSVLTVLQLIGGAYLIFMGIQSIRSGLANRHATTMALRPAANTFSHAYRLGILTNLSNPKAVLFFGAVFAQFVGPHMGIGWALILIATLLSFMFVIFSALALGASALGTKLTRASWIIDLVAGVIFIAVAIWMIAVALGRL